MYNYNLITMNIANGKKEVRVYVNNSDNNESFFIDCFFPEETLDADIDIWCANYMNNLSPQSNPID